MDRRTEAGTASKPASRTRFCSHVKSGKDGSTFTFDQACTALVKILCGASSHEALKAQVYCRQRSTWQSTTNELGMNAFFTALDGFELHTKCRIANQNSLQEAIKAAQWIESCRLAVSGVAAWKLQDYPHYQCGREMDGRVCTMSSRASQTASRCKRLQLLQLPSLQPCSKRQLRS